MTKALVFGFARSFISGEAIEDATITVIEDEKLKFKTDSQGKFGPIEWTVGEEITLVCEKEGSFWSGYRTIQSATLIVPPEGINSDNYLKNVSFQVPSNLAFTFFSYAMGVTVDPESAHIAATITPPDTTMDDIPQGIENVTVTLSPDVGVKPFYFGIVPFFHKTNPFVRNEKATTLDGGVAFINVPPGEYTLEAKKDGMTFSKVTIKAGKGALVNASPPFGPTMLKESKAIALEKNLHHFKFFQPAVELGVASVGVCVAENGLL